MPLETSGGARNFGLELGPDGHVFWRIEAVSRDGDERLTLIAFLGGGAFSPHYAIRRRAGRESDPLDHSAIYLALHSKGRTVWTMRERKRHRVKRDGGHLAIGPSRLFWKDDVLIAEIAEETYPLGRKVVGTVTLRPFSMPDHCVNLDPLNRYCWWLLAPLARVEVAFKSPAIAWSGHAMLDALESEYPFNRGIEGWDWSRAVGPAGAFVTFEVIGRYDAVLQALRIGRSGRIHVLENLPRVWMKQSRWRLQRGTRADDGKTASVIQPLIDLPFYSKSVIQARLFGQTVTSVHECVSMKLFHKDWVSRIARWRIPKPR